MSELRTDAITCILTGLNEGKEVPNTLKSIRDTTGEKTEIMFIDDCSNDGFDYESVCKEYNARYVRNVDRLGVSESRNLGVSLCDTEYFVILDAHMRFFDNGWDQMVIDKLVKYPKSVICSKTAVMKYDDSGNLKGEDGSKKISQACGAYFNRKNRGFEFSTVWSYAYLGERDDELVTVPCVLGAFYASSRTWWDRIGGINGLIKWGSDEAIMSVKTWLAGGECLCFKNFYSGHLYRKANPNPISKTEIERNEMYVAHFFLRDGKDRDEFDEHMHERLGDERYANTKKLFDETSSEVNNDREKFYKDTAIVGLDYFLQLNKLIMDKNHV